MSIFWVNSVVADYKVVLNQGFSSQSQFNPKHFQLLRINNCGYANYLVVIGIIDHCQIDILLFLTVYW